MSFREQKYLIVRDDLHGEPDIARWLWAFQDARRRTEKTLEGIARAALDWRLPNDASSIGTILYHLAAIEADWLYTEVLEQPFAADLAALFPHDVRDEHNQLTQVQGESLEQHLARLQSIRTVVLDVFRGMNLYEFRRVRSLPDYEVTPEWVLHHLMQHEAEHRSQFGALRAAAERAYSPEGNTL